MLQTSNIPAAGAVLMQRSQLQQMAVDVYDVLVSDPTARMPPDPATLAVMEFYGYVWNFETGQFEAENA